MTPDRPTYFRMKRDGILHKEGLVRRIESDMYPVGRGQIRTSYNFHWDDGHVTTVTADDGWTWEVLGEDEQGPAVVAPSTGPAWLNAVDGMRVLLSSVIACGPSPKAFSVRLYLDSGAVLDVEGSLNDFHAVMAETLKPSLHDLGDFT